MTTTEEWLDLNKKICLCRSIAKKHFLSAFEEGHLKIDEVNRKVGSGSGSCQGQRCRSVICQMLKEYCTRK
jgi:bacterioferritin-associated ferredoxin